MYIVRVFLVDSLQQSLYILTGQKAVDEQVVVNCALFRKSDMKTDRREMNNEKT